MRIKTLPLAFLLGTILTNAQGIVTQTRDDAGASGAGVLSGFYQTSYPVNFPSAAPAHQWWHLLDVRHTDPSNIYAMQFSGSYFDQDLYFRKTNNSATTPWNKIVMENSGGNVGIGVAIPNVRLEVRGGIRTSVSSNEGGSIEIFNLLKTGSSFNKWTIYNMTGPYGNSLQFWNYSADGTKSASRLKISDDGNMALSGKFEAKEVKVTSSPTADFVFEENYDLPKLEIVEQFIKENKHLPEIASAKVMEEKGVNIGEFQIKLLQKIEELTLYTIEQNKQLQEQSERIEKLEQQLLNKK